MTEQPYTENPVSKLQPLDFRLVLDDGVAALFQALVVDYERLEVPVYTVTVTIAAYVRHEADKQLQEFLGGMRAAFELLPEPFPHRLSHAEQPVAAAGQLDPLLVGLQLGGEVVQDRRQLREFFGQVIGNRMPLPDAAGPLRLGLMPEMHRREELLRRLPGDVQLGDRVPVAERGEDALVAPRPTARGGRRPRLRACGPRRRSPPGNRAGARPRPAVGRGRRRTGRG